MSVYEIYVEKKPQYADEAAAVAADLRMGLQLEKIEKVRLVNRYFAEGIEAQDFEAAKNTIFSEPPVDISYDSLPSFGDARVFAVEYLPGQFDQRADSCAQCISLATGKERPIIQSAKVYAVYGAVSDADFARVKSWLINPVESRQASLEKPATLLQKYPEPKDVETLNGFIKLNDTELEELRQKLNLAMDLSDIQFCQTYFLDKEKRDPTITEIRVLDTYWSDHCRHTTFLTELVNIDIEDETVNESYKRYLNLRASLSLGTRDEGRGTRESGSKTILDNNTNNIANKNPLSPVPCPQSPIPITLMDIATIGAKALKKRGLLPDLDESDEINACSVKIKVDIENNNEDWLLMFKNETHNHPTEIESFGGAATCLGGAIRDPLSGRSFVYQAMRVTGAGDPLQSETLPGKLPQRKICRTAAAGYSSYGNQIGLATGLVHEIYHPGYVAKRMEIGAVIGAAPEGNVVRETPTPGDVVILLGGRTGRDGIGGATGSSKSHTASSLETCGADVQKGNAPEERKIQRLFRNPQATRLIKRCNDFGAGGVSVSVGELADGITIDLDKVPKKYEGLDGTELAISESQERMSIVVAKDDVEKFFSLAASENLEATVIAQITEEKRLVMKWRGGSVVDLCREFLNSNGAKRSASVKIGVTGSGEREEGSGFCPKSNLDITNQRLQTTTSSLYPLPSSLSAEELETLISSLNICSQKGLVDRFDSSIGAATVIAPFGGKYQLTPAQVMAAKVPVLYGETKTVSLMSWGFDPEISSASPYHGAVFAVVHSLAKIIAAGGSRKKCWLSFQEYFERLRDDPVRWGKPFAALLGALDAQLGLEIAAIGGKDSMSGSFENIDVPPTLVSFAVSVTKIDNVVTPEFKKAGSFVYLLKGPETGLDFNSLRNFFDEVEKLIKQKKILSAWALGSGGTAEAIPKMCFGNRIGFCAKKELETGNGFCGFVVETDEEVGSSNEQLAIELLGRTTESYILKTPSIERFMFKIQLAWEKTLEPVYPYLGVTKNGGTHCVRGQDIVISNRELEQQSLVPRPSSLVPTFLIPVFPGTNSEYDTARAIEKAGGKAQIFVIRNLTPAAIAESVSAFAKALRKAQGLVIPGGFSGGDEPDGSGKFITAFIRNSEIADAVADLLQKRDGLICGICNGFQALIKLGLVPYGEIRDMTENSPTLTFNSIGRHQSVLVRTKIVSNKSPWLSHMNTGDTYIVPISHGEGRFIADEETIRSLFENEQIATQYVDIEGNPTQNIRYNPNNSIFAIEGITSPDGRVFGRMAHNERVDDGCYLNIPEIKKMDIFKGAVAYFNA